MQYLWASSPYYMNLGELWTDWPTREVSGLMKAYFLGQFSFWIQQILVINMEERRKDHWQMFTHHLLTSTLMYASYRFHFTRVGNLILVLMDVCDLLLAVSASVPLGATQPDGSTDCQVSQVHGLLDCL